MKKSLIYFALATFVVSCSSENGKSQYQEKFEELLTSENIQFGKIEEKKIFKLTERKKSEILCIENQQFLIDEHQKYERVVQLEEELGIYESKERSKFQFHLQYLLQICNECDSLTNLKDNKTEIGKLVWFNIEKVENRIDSIGVPFKPNGEIDKGLFENILETYLR